MTVSDDRHLLTRALRTFGIAGDVEEVGPLCGAANRVWRVATGRATFVVKEFRYTVDDHRWLAAVRTAALFERSIWEMGRIVVPRPLRRTDGELVVVLPGSRGGQSAVRMHEWLDGTAIEPGDADATQAAAELLAEVHRLGAVFATAGSGSLRWWRWQPGRILNALADRGVVDGGTAVFGREVLAAAERLIHDGEARPEQWVFSHYDLKPPNTKRVGDAMALLDWDEAAICHPGLEAVEAALQWAGVDHGEPDPELVKTFAETFRGAGGELATVQEGDFAKWVASRVIWFEYLGRRALREFGDDDEDAAAAAAASSATLVALGSQLVRLPLWAEAFNA